MNAISDIATDPNLQWIPQTGNGGFVTKAGDPARFIVEGIIDEVKIRVVLKPAINEIVTGFPISGSGLTCRAFNI